LKFNDIIDLESEKNISVKTTQDFVDLLNPIDPAVKEVADKIVVRSCNSGESICHAKALYYYIRDNYEYVADPIDEEYIEDPREFLLIGN